MKFASSTRSSSWEGGWSVLRDIEIICAVIAERKTTGAALRLGISQPAISRAITKIEAKLGKQLFHRENGRLVATAEALELYERSGKIFEALNEIGNVSPSSEQEKLSILGLPTLSRLFIEGEIAAFSKEYPNIRIYLNIGILEELPGAIAEQREELSMTDANVLHAGVLLETFVETSAVCIMPEGHPLADRQFIEPLDLDNINYVAIRSRHSLRASLDRIFAEAKAKPQVVIETNTAASAYDLVGRGLGVSVLNPFPLVLDQRFKTVMLPFRPRLPFKTSFVLPARTPISPVARRFVDFIKARRSLIPPAAFMA